MDHQSEIHNLTWEVMSLPIHHSGPGKSNREETINQPPVYVSPESDVLGTCKSFSFTLIASLNRSIGVILYGRGEGEWINPASECVTGRDPFFGLGLGTDVELKEPSITVANSSQLPSVSWVTAVPFVHQGNHLLYFCQARCSCNFREMNFFPHLLNIVSAGLIKGPPLPSLQKSISLVSQFQHRWQLNK